MPPTDTERAWTAGIIDGEGYIGIYSNPGALTLKLAVINTDLKMIHKLMDIWGGPTPPRKRAFPNGQNWKDVWEWTRVGVHAIKVLESVYPFLVTKRDRADIAAEYSVTLSRDTRRFPRIRKKEFEEIRGDYHKRIRILNRRGK